MLTTRQEQKEKLKNLINFEIKLNGGITFQNVIVALILYGIIIFGAIIRNDFTRLWLCLFPGIFVFIPTFFCLPLCIKHIKAKKNLIADNFSYYYLPIDNMEANGARGSTHMNAYYTLKGNQYIAWCNNYRARRVHVFDCGGFIISDTEEEKDLAL